MKQVQLTIDRDRQRRQQQHSSSMTGDHPYSPHSNLGRGTTAQQLDGRPPIRPITPIKSSQAMRQAQHSTNTSQITNNNYMMQNDSSMNVANTGQQQDGDQEGGDDTSRNLPSELKHRPKLPRTPLDNSGRPAGRAQNQSSEEKNNQSIVLPPVVKKNGD